jgi:hypothetical protein
MTYEVQKCTGTGELGQYHGREGWIILADGEQVGWRPDEKGAAKRVGELEKEAADSRGEGLATEQK